MLWSNSFRKQRLMEEWSRKKWLLYCLSPIIAEKTQQTSPTLGAVRSTKQCWVQLQIWRPQWSSKCSHECVQERCCKREALHRERGLNSRHVLIKKGLRVLTVSPPASLVSTQRPPSLPASSAYLPFTKRSECLYPNKGRRPGDACVCVCGMGGGGEKEGGGLCVCVYISVCVYVGGDCCPI